MAPEVYIGLPVLPEGVPLLVAHKMNVRVGANPVPSTRRNGKFELFRALRATIQADSHPVKESLFRSLTNTSFAARMAESLHRLAGRNWASTILVALYGLRSILVVGSLSGRPNLLVAVALHANARRQVRRVTSWFSDSEVEWVSFRARNAFTWRSATRVFAIARSVRSVATALRIIHRINLTQSFLVSCRATSTLALYVHAKVSLRKDTTGALVVSSDSNPEEIAFAGAARSLEIPTVFISHALPGSNAPALDFTLALLEGEAALAARQQRGPVKGDVFLLGLAGESKVMDARRLYKPNPVVGIFPPKVVAWSGLATCIEEIRKRLAPARIVVRWHPSMMERPRLADMPGVVEMAEETTLADAAAQCDWAISDPNSNVHIPLLKSGLPTVAVKGIGVEAEGVHDIYGIIANRIVFPPIASIHELSSLEAVDFYGGDWPMRFLRYDISYMKDPTEREAAACALIRQLATRG